MPWWNFGEKKQEEEEEEGALSSPRSSRAPKSHLEPEHSVSSALHVVSDAASDAAVGVEQREAVRMENREIWGRIKEGDTLWGLSEKYLGDPTKWPYLHAACRKELGPDPLRLLPGTHITEACIARARDSSRRARN